MLALSGLREGFARGLVSLHTPPLLGRKPSSAKSRVSISSKLIENKRFQVLYFGHLRKTGGGGELPVSTARSGLIRVDSLDDRVVENQNLNTGEKKSQNPHP
jgi:hypothetical protein